MPSYLRRNGSFSTHTDLSAQNIVVCESTYLLVFQLEKNFQSNRADYLHVSFRLWKGDCVFNESVDQKKVCNDEQQSPNYLESHLINHHFDQ